MDDTDRRLVSLLRDNARLPVASLAAILGISRATVQEQDRPADQGWHNHRVHDQAPAGRRGGGDLRHHDVEIEGERSEQIHKALRGFPEVSAIHTTNYRWDLVVELKTTSLDTFDKALRRIREMRGIASSETSLLLSSQRK